MRKYEFEQIDHHHIKERDCLTGKILNTEVFKEGNLTKVYSYFTREEDEDYVIIGSGKSQDLEVAISDSRKLLREKYKSNEKMKR